MEIIVKLPTTINIKTITCEMAVRYEEEDIPDDFPLRTGDMWIGTIDVETGEIQGWPVGETGELSMKVCDEGVYTLFDESGKLIAKKDGYVPSCIPSEYGDYVQFTIDKNGKIADWDKYFTEENVIESFFDE